MIVEYFLDCVFVGKMPPVLAKWEISEVPVFCRWSSCRVQYAAVYSAWIQSYRCQGEEYY